MGKKTIKAAGDLWTPRLGARIDRPGYRNVLFFCESNDQRPYRVVEVPADQFDGPGALERLSDKELRALFDGSASMSGSLLPARAQE
jgi:hypothetical protein